MENVKREFSRVDRAHQEFQFSELTLLNTSGHVPDIDAGGEGGGGGEGEGCGGIGGCGGEGGWGSGEGGGGFGDGGGGSSGSEGGKGGDKGGEGNAGGEDLPTPLVSFIQPW